jgi:hypothetical protein
MKDNTSNDPTKNIEVFIVDDGPNFVFDVFERWGTPPNTIGKLTRHYAPWGFVKLALPTQLVPRIVAAISDQTVRADFLACIGSEQSLATMEEIKKHE